MSRTCNQVESVESKHLTQCGPLPGTILRIFLPPGTVINLLNLIEIASPSGVCLIVRLPFLDTESAGGVNSLIQTIQQAGGTIEFTKC